MTDGAAESIERYAGEVRAHVRAFFSGHATTLRAFDRGPIRSVVPGFHVIEVAPGPAYELWTYVSVGAGRVERAGAGRVEFVITAERPDPAFVERLAMTAHYHATQTLGPGHTFPLGEPWLPGSTLDHALVSLPYPFGPELEVLERESGHVHLLWLLPITAAERRLKIEAGLEALEARFDDAGLEYWDASRASVV